MKTHKVKVVVLQDGKIAVDGLPVLEGDEGTTIDVLDPLHSAPLRYDDPFEPAVDPSEWHALT